MAKKILNNDTIKVFLIILELYLNFSVWLIESMDTKVRCTIMLVISVILLFFNKKVAVRKNSLFAILVLFGIPVISWVLMGTYELITFSLLMTTLTAAFFVYAISYEDFSKALRMFMISECICSLVVFAGYYLEPGLFDAFPVINTWRNGTILFKNVFVSVIPVSMMGYYRNFGVFVEPGVHAIIISFALMEELFFRKPNLKVVFLYILTVITTISTSGVITVVLIMTTFLFDKSKNIDEKNMKKIRFGIIAVFIASLALFIVLYQKGVITSYIFDKLSKDDTISGSDRREGYEVTLREFFDNPVLGMGVKKSVGYYYVQKGIIQTATIINWFSVFGVFYGAVCVGGLWRFVRAREEKMLFVSILLLGTLLLMGGGQDFSQDFFMFTIILFGYNMLKKDKQDDVGVKKYVQS